jgi:GNAT superfamily N-acetyltransferase
VERFDVVAVERAHWREVSGALAASFYDDPVFSWLLPNDATRAAALQRYFAIEARHIVLEHGLSFAVTDRTGTVGVALILPPGQWRTPLRVQVVYGPGYLRTFRRRTPRALGVLMGMERRHLRRPHYYLPYIGVVPAAQGRGLGTALLEPMLDCCDREGIPAYLEASNARCARLYQRLGFGTIEEISPLGAPPLQLMTRDPGR